MKNFTKTHLSITLGFLLIFTASALGQRISFNELDGATKNPSDLSVSEIYSKHLAYIDPGNITPMLSSITRIDASSGLLNSEFSGQSSSTTTNTTMANFRDNLGRVASVMKMENMNTKTIFDGSNGYTEMDLMGGSRTEMTEELKAMYKVPDMDLLVRERRIPEGAGASLVSVSGRNLYGVSYVLNSSSGDTEVTEYYDASTFEKSFMVTKANLSNGTNNTSIQEFTDYQDFDGLIQHSRSYSAATSTFAQGSSVITSETNHSYKLNESFSFYRDGSLSELSSALPAIPTGSVSSSAIASAIGGTSSSSAAVPDQDSAQIAAELASVENLEESEYFKSLNLRERAYQLSLRAEKLAGTGSGASFAAAVNTVNTAERKEKIKKMDAAVAGKLKYRRSSLYTMMLDDNRRERYRVIKDAFGNAVLSEKFNDHNIGPYLIPAHGMSGEKDQTKLIEQYLNNKGVARDLVAKWFNRDENGNFNMNLIAERGQYNASEIDVKVAQSSVRGKAMLADAGRELIGNTFVIVYDYKYTNKQEQAKKRGGFLDIVSTAASIAGMDDVANIAQGVRVASDVMGKGYFVRTTSYLYRLVWNDDVANEFYTYLWNDATDSDPKRKELFDRSDLFKLEYVGSEKSRNNLQSTIFTSKSDNQLIEIATTRAVDKNIGKLQRTYEEFRVKTPLLSTDPIAAQIGTKEDIERGDKFEVLEQILDEDGTTYYDKIGTIKVQKVWDNAYVPDDTSGEGTAQVLTEADLEGLSNIEKIKMAAAELKKKKQQEKKEGERNLNYTIFKGSAKKLAPGMLIRQIN